MNSIHSRAFAIASRLAFISLAILAINPQGLAEELRISVGQQGADHAQVQRPRQGWKQGKVLDTFGDPEKVIGPVGQPPITQWHYPHFVVYLENQYVLHSVLKPKVKTQNSQ